MTSSQPLRVALGLSVWLLLLGQTGCLSFCHPLEAPPPEEVTSCNHIPLPCRHQVYIFFVQGEDPLDCANLGGVRDYVQSLGFIKTYYGQIYHMGYFTDEIRRIHKCEPEARFALLGFGVAANSVRHIANAVRADDITIDLLVYLSGNLMKNDAEDHPKNVLRLINILVPGCLWDGVSLDHAENITCGDAWYFGSPTHLKTLEVLAHQLTEVAARIPLVERVYPPEKAPTPRPVVPRPAGPRDDWDFLLPGGPIPEVPAKPTPLPHPRPYPSPYPVLGGEK